MKITYDPSVDAAYIKLVKGDEAASFGFSYVCDSAEVHGHIVLDFDVTERLIGIEVLQASQKLRASLLDSSTRQE
jgi:uncharacterized protein YuzE